VTAEEQTAATVGQAANSNAPKQVMNFDALGIAVTGLTADSIKRLGLPKDVKGVVVDSVTNSGLAQQSGVARGMIVIQVDKTPVTSADDFRAAVERASREKGAVLHVLRQNGDVDFVILRGQ
jgi:serine protease Do